jgi:outer membrane murein-binding lipoprotein Lpp
MSVHQESLELTTPKIDPIEASLESEYKAARSDSLSMFGAAIGGAILGMLLTLLVLAIINGGTLSFSGGERMDAIEANMARINENVGAVSTNVDTVAEQAGAAAVQAGAVQTQLDKFETTMASELETVNESIATLDQTREQFNTFVGALTDALNQIEIPEE